MPIPSAFARRLFNRVRGTWHDQRVRVETAAARVATASRVGLAAAGRAASEIAILECRRGNDVSGLFSEFAAVVGMLDHYERWRRCYAGLKVVFDEGLYFDASVGPNWWNYYFAPIDLVSRPGAPARVVNPYYHDLCANRVERTMPRDRGAALIAKYITPGVAVNAVVEPYLREHWGLAHIVGIHYRGTDKAEDAPRVPYDHVASVAREAMTGPGIERCRIFLATDETACVDFMRVRFPGQVICREMFRSADGRPIDVVNADGNYQKGLDAVVDCLLLSRTHHLIRTASNLSLCSALFNPHLPDRLLNPER